MRTFKLLLPVIVNLLLVFIFFYIMDIRLLHLIDRPGMSIEVYHLRLFVCVLFYYLIVFLVTVFWLVGNGKRYLSHSVNIRYLVCGMGVSGIADVVGFIFNYMCFHRGVLYL